MLIMCRGPQVICCACVGVKQVILEGVHDFWNSFNCSLSEIIFSAFVSCSLTLFHASPQQNVNDSQNDVVVLSDRPEILFKESRHPQNMPLICYYFSDADFFASLSWVTSTKEIQVKLPTLSSF